MKILYLLVLILLSVLNIQAQSGFTLDFEDTTVINQHFYTDSIIDPQGIWQIGPPHKSFMNSALTQPNAVVTGLDSLLPPGSRGSFIITVPNAILTPSIGLLFTFEHRYEFDPAHGGGYVEFSVDTGQHWHGVFADSVRESCHSAALFNPVVDTVDGQIIPKPQWWGTIPSDTTAGGLLYFTGTDSTWINDTIIFPVFLGGEKTSQVTQCMFRFTAFADSLSPALGGWLIDNINFFPFAFINCGGGINEINSSHLQIYPNPASSSFELSILDEPESNYDVRLSDISGRVLMQRAFTGQTIRLDRGAVDAGSYFIQVTDSRSGSTFQKRVMFE